MKDPDIPSPCLGLCKIDPKEHLCLGCLRTRAEITTWRQASYTEKATIMKRLILRHAKRNYLADDKTNLD